MLRVEINSAFAPPPLIFRSFDLIKFSFLLMTFRMSTAAGGENAGNNQRRIAAKPFTAVKVNLMLNIVRTALYLGVCVYWPC
jgi:hypothetical protein